MSHDFKPTEAEKAMLEDMNLEKFMDKTEKPKPRVHDFSSSACIGCEG